MSSMKDLLTLAIENAKSNTQTKESGQLVVDAFQSNENAPLRNHDLCLYVIAVLLDMVMEMTFESNVNETPQN